MAITLVTAPGYYKLAAFNPIEFTYSSDRYAGTEASITPTGHADNGSSFIRVTYNSHGYIVGDVITGAGFSDSSLNIAATITAKTSNTFDLDIAWEAGFATDLGGTWTRTNDNFMMRCQVKNVGGSVIDTLYVDPNTSDQFVFDVAETLKTQLSETILALATTALTSSNTGSYFVFSLTLTELFDDAGGQQKSGDSANETLISGQAMTAYNMVTRDTESVETTFTFYNAGSKQFLTDMPVSYRARIGTYLQLSFLSAEDDYYSKVTQYWRDGSAATETRIPAAATVSDTGGRAIIPLPAAYFTAAVDYITVKVYDSDDNQMNATLTIYVDPITYQDHTHIMFKNHLGGFDTYTFIDCDVVDSPDNQLHKSSGTEKTFYVDPKRTYQLIGAYETNEVLTWLHELYNSKVVYRIDGTSLARVNIIPGSYILETHDMIQPVVQIKDQPLTLN